MRIVYSQYTEESLQCIVDVADIEWNIQFAGASGRSAVVANHPYPEKNGSRFVGDKCQLVVDTRRSVAPGYCPANGSYSEEPSWEGVSLAARHR